MKLFARIALGLLLGVPAVGNALSAQILQLRESPQASFAVADLESALRARKYFVIHTVAKFARSPAEGRNVRVTFVDASDPLLMRAGTPEIQQAVKRIRPEGFILRRSDEPDLAQFTVLSIDAAGAMYGGFELAEQIRAGGIENVVPMERNPHMRMRGTKFNIPLDLRTPSYSDMSDSAQANIDTVWDFEFWKAYLDQLARDRYNFVSLWNLHPFPSMVKVPEYPDVALDDVWRSKIQFDEDYSTRTTGIVTPAMLANKEVVRQLTIEQKIEFWRRVMRYAKDRNIDFHVVTWNIYTYGVDGKYGITDAIDNPKTRDYFRASVREMFRTYPLLAGIGLTSGENMGDPSPSKIGGAQAFQVKEDWVYATYGQGVLDVARAQPTRKLRLIHRQHETRAQDIAATFRPVIAQPNVDFVFSFKYAQAHALSSTTQPFPREFLASLGDHETLWTIRNDDALLFRWAAPDFVREFVRNIPMDKTRGFYFGSDMWVPGRDFLSRFPHLPRQLEVEKHWLHILLWGRLGYDPTLDNERIARLIEARFPGVDGANFLAAWQNASMIYPLVTGFHWADFDFQWYIEACRSRPEPARTASGFHSVETFITQKVHPGTNNVSIPDYVTAVTNGNVLRGITPLQVADLIDARAAAAQAGLKKLVIPRNTQAEFDATFADLRTMALLGSYYAAKIRGATELALFRATRKPEHQKAAVKHLGKAANQWTPYAFHASKNYGPRFWTNRVGYVDWQELTKEVGRDIEIAQAPLP